MRDGFKPSGTGRRLRRGAKILPLASSLALLAFTTSAAAPVVSAGAYNQSYNCESFVGQSTCNQTAGSWYTLTNVGGTNWNASGDVCIAWGNLKSTTLQCAGGGSNSTLECAGSGTYGYGWAETADGLNWNISGHEDNYSGCT